MPRNSVQSERRAFGRRESFIHAIARLPGRGAEPCIVRNYSDTGALLAFAADIDPPERFRLHVEAKGVDVMCEVRRRVNGELGVRFMDEGEAGASLMGRTLPAHVPAEEPAAPLPPPQKLALSGNFVTVVTGADMRRLMGI
jgi:hypothetical protein